MTYRRVGKEIVSLLQQGFRNKEICERLGVDPSSVTHHAKKMNLTRGHGGRRKDWDQIRAYYESGASYEDCCEKFGTTLSTLWKASKRGLIAARPSGGIDRAKSLAQMIQDHAGVRGSSARSVIRRKVLAENAIYYHCAVCGIDEWNGKPLTLRLDHIDGDGGNHALDNLRFVCPNCDSQSDTYCFRNRGRYQSRGIGGTVDTPVLGTGALSMMGSTPSSPTT